MWDLDCEESWAPKNWCFWTVVLEKMLESPLDCKEIQLVHPEGDKSCVFIGRTDAEAETPLIWPPHANSWLIGKDPDAGRDWGQDQKVMTEDEVVRRHHRLNGHEFEKTLEFVMDREAWHAVIHGVAKNWTRLSNWTELNWHDILQTDHNHPTLYENSSEMLLFISSQEIKLISLCIELLGHKTCFNKWDRKKIWHKTLKSDFTLYHSPLLLLEDRYQVTKHKRISRKLENKKFRGGKLRHTSRQPFSKSGC